MTTKKKTKKAEQSLTDKDLQEIAAMLKRILSNNSDALMSREDLNKIFAMFEAISNQIADIHSAVMVNRRLFSFVIKERLSHQELVEFAKIQKTLEEGTIAEKLQN